jgi:SAM-dependent methyltransferase
LEVGSRNVNGSVREFFRGAYTGMDMQDGNGVDVVARADKIPFKARSFQVVACTEMLEHDPYPWKSIPEMARVLAPGGILLLTCRGVGFHDDPNPLDLWRFTCDSIEHLFTLAKLEPLEVIPDTDPSHEGVFGIARKR